MRAFLYTGGHVDVANITTHPKGDDLVIAVDSGWNNAVALGEKPTVLVGDFDSLGEENIPTGVELIRLQPEKDKTDTQVAIEVAIERGATEIDIVGGLSGRLDHTLSNLFMLECLAQRGIYAIAYDGISRARYLDSSSVIIGRSQYRYVSVLAVDEKVKGVEIDGCKYPLKKATLYRNYQYAVSNEIDGNCTLIAVKKGKVFIIESRDPQV